MSVDSFADWRPPEGGITAENVHSLPGLALPAHTELIDGGLFFPGPHRESHAALVKLLVSGLGTAKPDQLRVLTHEALTLGLRTRVEPDILVLAPDADANRLGYRQDQVLLIVEVVSPITQIRDRELKPQYYAKAGIPHFWRVEEEATGPAVYVYELDPATQTYFLTGTQRTRVMRPVPYRIDIDLSGLAPV